MKSKDYSCIICLEPITNPVCRECYIREIGAWLKENIKSDVTKKIVLLSIIHAIPKNDYKKDRCILCEKEEVSTCSYCFFLKTFQILKNINIPEYKIDSFRETFNYSLGHSDYHI